MCGHTVRLQNKRLAMLQDRGLEYNNTTLYLTRQLTLQK